MKSSTKRVTMLCVAVLLSVSSVGRSEEDAMSGETLTPDMLDAGVVETWAEMLARDEATGMSLENPKARQGRRGKWAVPSRRSSRGAHSGEHYVVNKMGDTRMGIRFPSEVTVVGAYFVGQGNHGASTPGVRAIGYRGEEVVKTTEWSLEIGEKPTWFAIDLEGVDRLVIECIASVGGAGWYGMDDLTFIPMGYPEAAETTPVPVVLDFEDLDYRAMVTGSGYGGLVWESGTDPFGAREEVHPPLPPPGEENRGPVKVAAVGGTRSRNGTAPELVSSFKGVKRGDAGRAYIPPDTMGAIGPNHFVEVVNLVFAVYDRDTGANLDAIGLDSFLPGSRGDPRVLYDQHSGRWVLLNSNFDYGSDYRIYLAVSTTSNPLDSWYKTSFIAGTGADAGCWVDYPTLGVDANGIYTGAYMVGCGMTAFAIEKAPLIAPSPSLGTVTAWRGLDATTIQPVHTYGTAPGEYLVSRRNYRSLHLFRVNPPLTSPSLSTLPVVPVPDHYWPDDVPALGSSVDLDVVGPRLMMAVYRDGSIWTTHCVDVNGRAAVRWYEIDPTTSSQTQYGTVSDSTLHFFFPSIMVNSRGQVAIGFTGSSASQYAAGYFTGRLPSDPAGETGTPVLLKAGEDIYQVLDDWGRNRWGDYSYTTLDPRDGLTFWTIQEYAHVSGSNSTWGTWIGELSFGDCNGNGVDDDLDITGGTSVDCQPDGRPDECQLGDNDCNGNEIPDECDAAALIDVHPANTSGCAGETFGFEVVSTNGAATYQWYHDYEIVPDATDPVLVVSGATTDDEGEYWCVVTAGCIQAQSDTATLTLIPPPTDGALSNRSACEGGATTFTATFTGVVEAYAWYKVGNPEPLVDGGNISGTTTNKLAFDPLGPIDVGSYYCIGSNGCGTDATNNATLTVMPLPEILAQPEDVCTNAGGTAILHADTGVGIVQYVWLKWDDGGEAWTLPSVGNESGIYTDTLTISPVEAANAARYMLWLKTAFPCEDFSDEAVLTVGGCCGNAVAGDIDGDTDVDLKDFALFQACFGTGMGLVPGCECANMTSPDNDVDLSDYTLWVAEFAGPS